MNVQRKSGVTSFREKALLVQLVYDRDAKEEAEASLAELERLVDTVGATVVGSITQRRERRPIGRASCRGRVVRSV